MMPFLLQALLLRRGSGHVVDPTFGRTRASESLTRRQKVDHTFRSSGMISKVGIVALVDMASV